MVFQSYALFPHMNVRKNIGFGLKLQKMPQGQIDDRVDELLSLVHMDGLGDRTIERISGGQQQRVALARSLALEPKVLLLDEPLSNLDANLRVVMRDEIRSIQERIGITTIFVTHDQYEAMSISDRILVLNDKIIQQIGSPSDIYETPVNQFIAEFVGYVNFLEGKVENVGKDTSEGILVATEYGNLSLTKINQKDFAKDDEVLLVIRPETVTLFPSDAEDLPNMLTGKIQDSMYAGNLVKYTIRCGDREILIDQYNPMDSIRFRRGDNIKFTVPKSVHALPKK
jgi:ABC-type Fe3+/spermidine/putrescine transport system ATPase subunit